MRRSDGVSMDERHDEQQKAFDGKPEPGETEMEGTRGSRSPSLRTAERHVDRDIVAIDLRVNAKGLGVDDISPEIIPLPANRLPLR